jgi:UDP-GlcNAc3NAcA epimerase
MRRRVLTVVGARPQFVKAAAFSRAVAGHCRVEEILVHTGQHFDHAMSEAFFHELAIPPPRYNLGIASLGHGAMTGRMLEALEVTIAAERPDAVLVYGDTNSTLAGALAAAKLHVPVCHVEAGLRSFNRRMPEEVNRVLTDQLSDLLLCPTRAAVANLRREGVERGVHHVGDIMFDVALHARNAAARSDVLERLGVGDGGFRLATVHRAENTDTPQRLRAVLAFLAEAAREAPIVLPLHPRTRQKAAELGLGLDGLRVCGPVGYLDMTRLLMGCRDVLTDSGGLQKEAYFHGKPCITLRDETEWVETLAHGWNRLWTARDYLAPRRPIDEYGAGETARRVLELLESLVCG